MIFWSVWVVYKFFFPHKKSDNQKIIAVLNQVVEHLVVGIC